MQNSSIEIIDHASVINNYLINLLVKSVTGCAGVPVTAIANTELSTIDPAVAFQLYYNNDTNKCYIQVDTNDIFKNQYFNSLTAIKATFSNYLNENFKKDTTVWPEVVFPEDGKREICDSNELLTPFTIGYWRSLTGRFEFLNDKAKIIKDYNDMVFPNYGDEYYEKVNQIFNEYYKTDFETFNEKIYELNLEYDIKLDPTPRKDFQDFINTVEEINKLYAQTVLDEETKAEFIDEYMNILATLKNDPDALKIALNQLYEEYGIKANLNSKIPEIFELYVEEYRNFFEKELTRFELAEDVNNHNNDNVEIWTYEGDFDFGEYVYHPEPAPGEITLDVDPDSVAMEDYDYNEAAEYIVLRTYYDIIEKN